MNADKSLTAHAHLARIQIDVHLSALVLVVTTLCWNEYLPSPDELFFRFDARATNLLADHPGLTTGANIYCKGARRAEPPSVKEPHITRMHVSSPLETRACPSVLACGLSHLI